ncbi:hypothetical protein Q5H93_13010 [Hymenobacter sp. ASUV-10]|uniref:Outer membrane protein beta-barrel domain-containing protein n=1 Tax=Hymenobacter aranciens TaxID=3063996 RepID=A0ABT9BBU1_9BACT|nr:hypothetical protein [Hymenobacter sp. ASUV-10]MDO7875657.1 hypothetical protein [Hymenobacter sp. ASUV-10]
MTDPKPDPLFDALREQLADYGQEPPAHLWAGIRQQLPAPVALPQRRRRRAWSVALLALLLLVTGVVSWQAWELSPLRRPTVAGQADRRAPDAPNGLPTPAGPRVATTSTSPTAADATVASATTTALAATPATAAASSKTPASASTTPATTTVTTKAAPAVATSSAPVAATRSSAGDALVEVARASRSAAISAAGPTPSSSGPTRNTRAAAAAHSSVSTATGAHPSARPGAAGRILKAQTFATIATRKIRSGAARTQLPRDLATASGASKSIHNSTRPVPHPTLTTASASVEHDQPTTTAANTITPAKGQPLRAAAADQPAAAAVLALAYDQLALRQPTLPAPLLSPLPESPAQPIQRSMAAVPPPARWVAQTLFGPALTGVRLGSPSRTAGNVPASFVTMVTDEEQATRSGSAQFSLRHNFKTHWSLSAGLGAAEYATESTLRQRYFPNITSSLDPSAVRIDSFVVVRKYRKSYQFFSLPVRLGYAWQPSLRWQLGLLAGAEATYLFHAAEITTVPLMTGTFASTSAATRQWGLGSSLALEARYHFSPRCELLAQPTFTYLLTPLNRERIGEAPRHPWGAALLLGVAYELR